MGTRCVRLALLLLAVVLQYAAAGGAPPTCEPAAKPKSQCPVGLINEVKCKVLPADNKCTDPPKTYLLSKSVWKEIGQLECGTDGKWKAKPVAAGATSDVAPPDNIVCAAKDPATKCDTTRPPNLPKSECGTMPLFLACEKYDGTTKACKNGNMYIESGSAWTQVEKLVTPPGECDWVAKAGTVNHPVTTTSNAICAKYPPDSCDPTDKPATTCPAGLQAFVDCKNHPAVFSDPCPGQHHKYSLIASSGKWHEMSNVECRVNKWTTVGASPQSVTKADAVVCAKYPPDSKSCTSKNPTTDCTNVDVNCQTVTFPEIGTIQCSKNLYLKSGGSGWAAAKKIECDMKTGQWKQTANGAYVSPTDNVVCAISDPSILSCINRKTLRTECPDHFAVAADCSPLPAINDKSTPTCTGKNLYVENANGWTEVTGVKCNTGSGDWVHQESTLESKLDGDNLVCAASDPGKISCKGANPLSEAGCDEPDRTNHLGNCDKAVAPADDSDIDCTSSSQKLYFKKLGGTWTEAAAINCDKDTGAWTASGTQLVAGDFAICIDDDPTKIPTDCRTFDAECGPILNCGKPNLRPIGPVTCPTSTPILYFNKDFGPFETVADNALECDTNNGQWQQGSVNKKPLDATDVICATDVIPTVPDGACPMLRTTCMPTWKSDNGCEKPTNPFDKPICTASKKFYFKKAGVAKFQEASAIACSDEGKWELKYTFGKTEKTSEMVAGDHLICADSNPDTDVCTLWARLQSYPPGFEADSLFTPAKFEAGKAGDCGDNTLGFDFISQTKDVAALGYLSPPVCQPDGTWSKPSGDELFGDRVACARQKCKKCEYPKPPTITYANMKSPAEIEYLHSGTCSGVTCKADGNKFVIKVEDEEDHYTFAGQIECKDDGNYVFDGKPIYQIACAQQLYCIEPGVVQVNRECPSDNSIPDCVPATLHDPPNANAAESLTCPEPKKMFIRDDTKDELYWDEIKGQTITCDVNTGKWPVNVVGGTQEEKRGHHHTIICADSNPKPKSTTTTTTTTPAPLLPICEVCSGLKFYRDCKECVNSTKLEDKSSGEKGPDDKCLLKPNEGASLLYNNFQTVSDYLQCVRSDGNWKTATGAHVNRIISQLKAKEDKWLTLSYLIVGGAFLAIGGMAIGCVVIYMRMRKQLSSREKKKKERGVTKKYTSSNVVKTNTKTDGGSRESSKSKVSGSKMDDNLEDTPTLKIY